MSQSYTILPYVNAPAGAFDSINAVQQLNNNFAVSQTFAAGIVDSGSLSVVGTSAFTGVCTFTSIPRFLAGIEVSIAEVDTGTLVVSGSTTLNGGCAVSGAVLSSSAGLTVSAGATSLLATTIQGSLTVSSIVDAGALSCTSLTCAGITDTGALSCTSLTCSSVVDAGTLSCTALTCSGITDTGALSCSTISASGVASLSAGITFTGPVINNSLTSALTCVSNDVALDLALTSFGNWSLVPAVGVNTITISNSKAGACFTLLINPSAAITFRKALSAGTVTIYNNLSGNQSMASGSKWIVRGNCISATVVYLDFTNMT